MKRQGILAALVAAAALAFAGSAEASITVSSPPAPHRATVSPRRSVAGASATATHAARRHARRHHHRHVAPHQELVASTSTPATGGSPPQPAHRPTHNHHADLSPVHHGLRPQIRLRSGWQGSAAEASAGAATHAAMKRLCLWSMATPLSNEDRLIFGRGPPRGSPDAFASSSRRARNTRSTPTLLRFTTQSHRPSTLPSWNGTGFIAVPMPAAWEGAVACLDSPSVGDLT